MGTIEGSFNLIWKIQKQASFGHAIFTLLGNFDFRPVIFRAWYIRFLKFTSAYTVRDPTFSKWRCCLNYITPGVDHCSFFSSFFLVPYRPVIFRDAIIGGLVAAIFFEIAKYCFTLFIAFFPSQQIIYGAFAVIPIFIWVYVSWLIILVGAEISKCVEYFNIDRPLVIWQTKRLGFYIAN